MELNSSNIGMFKDNNLVTIQDFGNDYKVIFSTLITLSQNITTIAYICEKNGFKTPLVPQEFLSINESTSVVTETLPNLPTDVIFKFVLNEVVDLINPPTINNRIEYQNFKITRRYITFQGDIYQPTYEISKEILNPETNINDTHYLNNIEKNLIYHEPTS